MVSPPFSLFSFYPKLQKFPFLIFLFTFTDECFTIKKDFNFYQRGLALDMIRTTKKSSLLHLTLVILAMLIIALAAFLLHPTENNSAGFTPTDITTSQGEQTELFTLVLEEGDIQQITISAHNGQIDEKDYIFITVENTNPDYYFTGKVSFNHELEEIAVDYLPPGCSASYYYPRDIVNELSYVVEGNFYSADIMPPESFQTIFIDGQYSCIELLGNEVSYPVVRQLAEFIAQITEGTAFMPDQLLFTSSVELIFENGGSLIIDPNCFVYAAQADSNGDMQISEYEPM